MLLALLYLDLLEVFGAAREQPAQQPQPPPREQPPPAAGMVPSRGRRVMYDVSFFQRIVRRRLKPHVCAAPVIPAPQAPADVVIVRVVLPAAESSHRVAIWFTTGDRTPPPVTPLETWRGNEAPAGQ